MEEHNLTNEQILAFSTALFQAERSQATIEKYLRSVRAFSLFLDGRPVTKDIVMAWKKHLQREENYSPSTVTGDRAGAGPSRLREVDRRRARLGPGADRPRHGDHLCHGHPGGRGAVHHGGGCPGWQRHYLVEG